MRILVLLAQHHWTGPAQPEIQKLQALKETGDEVTFCFSRKPEGTLKDFVPKEAFSFLENVQLYRKRPGLIRFWKDLRLLNSYCEYWKPDIIHCHLSHDHWTGVALRTLLSKEKPALVRTIHESRKLAPNIGDRILHRRTDGFILPSEGFMAQFIESYKITDKPVAVVGGVVDVEWFKPGLETSEVFKEIGASPDAPLIGIVSRIKEGRGHREIINSFRNLMEKYPGARLLIIGRGEGLKALESQNHDLVTGKRLHFMGYRKEDLPNLLNALLFKVILAEGSDGACRAALEAMSCQTPVVAADIGILPETVSDGKTGLIVPEGDGKSLDRAFDFALANPDKMKMMGINGREYILNNHSIEKAARKMKSLYMKVAQR